MTDLPKKRPWFRFHLSTWLLLSLLGVFWVWINVHDWGGTMVSPFSVHAYGHPFFYYMDHMVPDEAGNYDFARTVQWWMPGGLVLDIVLGLGVLAGSGVLCERVIAAVRRSHDGH